MSNPLRNLLSTIFSGKRAAAWLLVLLTLNAPAATVDEILARQQPPEGVVFELVEGSKQDLNWAIPRIREETMRLRARFPDLPIAVVSHGREEFGLTRAEAEKRPEVHEMVKDLSGNLEVPVHVCATHAAWYDVPPEAFPDYVEVSASGPAQINDYIALGYLLVIVSKPQ